MKYILWRRAKVNHALGLTVVGVIVATLVAPAVLLTMRASASSIYLASDVLGQVDQTGQPTYTQDFKNSLGLPGSGGFKSPSDVQIDTMHHKLYVSEGGGANRIQVYNLDSSNQLLDRVPDYVIGQPKFGTSSSGVAQNRLFVPLGMALDVSGQRLFVADNTNNRVMVYDTSALATNINASYVLGQPNFTSSTAATTQAGMDHPTGLAYDAAGQRLFVADIHRVLVFSTSTLTNGQAAVNVIGQSNFTTGSCTPISQTKACPWGVAYDASGQRLFVSGQARVLVFNVSTISNGMTATNVLGQSNFTASGAAVTQSGLTLPRYMSYDSTNNQLFVGDNKRIVVYSTSSITNGENASYVLGQTDFTSSATGTTQNHFTSYGMYLNEATMRLYVADLPNNRIMTFDVSSITNGQNAIDEIGQTDIDGTVRWTTNFLENNYTNKKGMSMPTGVTEDITGHRLFVADSYNGRVMIYNLDTSNNLIDHTADGVLGAPDLDTSSTTTTQSTMSNPQSLAYDATRNWLYVMDDSRILVFDVASVANGENALYVLGQSSFTGNTTGLTATQFDGQAYDITYDSVHKRLFAVDNSASRVLVFDMTTPSNGMAASHVIGQADFTTDAFISDDASMFWPQATAYDSVNNRLYVADTWNGRILVFDMNVLSNGMAASYVIGQPDFATYDSPGDPGQNDYGAAVQGMFFDPTTQYLWAADWTDRVLIFDTKNLTNFMNASAVIGQTDYGTSNYGGPTQNYMSNAYDIFVDPTNQRAYIADNWGNRVMVFDTVHITTESLPDGTVSQSYSGGVGTSGTQGNVALSLTSGSLPSGLSMNSSGQITGTPTTAGTYAFSVSATDDNGTAGALVYEKSLSITVAAAPAPPLQQTPSSSPATSSFPYPSMTTTTDTTSTTGSKTIIADLTSDPDYATSSGSTETLGNTEAVSFTLPGTNGTSATPEKHTVTVNSVTDTYVDLAVASEPIYLRLYIGDNKSVDVNRDGINDINITLLGIVNHKAQLVFKQLLPTTATTTQPTTTKPTVTTSQANPAHSNSSGKMIAEAAILLVVAGVVVAVIRSRRHRMMR